MILSEHELNDAVWLKLKAHYESKLLDRRKQNDDPNKSMTEAETARLRGQIKEIKDFISIGTPELDVGE